MAGNRTRTLLLLLAGAAALVAASAVVVEALGNLAAARADAVRLEVRIARLREEVAGAAGAMAERDALRAEVAALAARRYDAGTMNPYAFATLVKARLSSLGVAVRRYRVVEGGTDPCVEVEAAGSVRLNRPERWKAPASSPRGIVSRCAGSRAGPSRPAAGRPPRQCPTWAARPSRARSRA